MARALVTGASGFIGKLLVDALLARGDNVRCLVRNTSVVEPLRQSGAELANGDVISPETLPAALAGVEVVYHLAGLTKAFGSAAYHRVNEAGVRNVVDACAARTTPPVMVLVSSLAAAGPMIDRQRLRTESDAAQPVSHYGLSKRAGELAAESRAGDVPITVVRPPIVLGPGDRTGFVLFRNIRRFRLYFMFGQGRRVSVVYVSDLASGLIAAAERGERLPAPDQASMSDHIVSEPGSFPASVSGRGYYFVAGDEHPQFSDLNRLIARSVGRPRAWTIRLPLRGIWAAGAASELVSRITRRPDYVNIDRARELTAGHWTCSPDKARRDLGFAPGAPLPQRIEQTAQWYREQGWL
jgi:nucleoside-diphosphate-sugar epimerase